MSDSSSTSPSSPSPVASPDSHSPSTPQSKGLHNFVVLGTPASQSLATDEDNHPAAKFDTVNATFNDGVAQVATNSNLTVSTYSFNGATFGHDIDDEQLASSSPDETPASTPTVDTAYNHMNYKANGDAAFEHMSRNNRVGFCPPDYVAPGRKSNGRWY